MLMKKSEPLSVNGTTTTTCMTPVRFLLELVDCLSKYGKCTENEIIRVGNLLFGKATYLGTHRKKQICSEKMQRLEICKTGV